MKASAIILNLSLFLSSCGITLESETQLEKETKRTILSGQYRSLESPENYTFAEEVVQRVTIPDVTFGTDPRHYPNNVLGLPAGSRTPKAPNANPGDLVSLGSTQEYSGYVNTGHPERDLKLHKSHYLACLRAENHAIRNDQCVTPDGSYAVPLPTKTLTGSITLKFSKKVIRGRGFDFFVHENPLQYNHGGWYKEYGRVSVSPDNVRWYTYPCQPLKGDVKKCAGHLHTPDRFSEKVGFGGDGFELEDTPFSQIQYIKIEDATPVTNIFTQTEAGKHTQGFDLDGVSGLWK